MPQILIEIEKRHVDALNDALDNFLDQAENEDEQIVKDLIQLRDRLAGAKSEPRWVLHAAANEVTTIAHQQSIPAVKSQLLAVARQLRFIRRH